MTNPSSDSSFFVSILSCSLRAEGLGPCAVFSYDVLDVGDTYAGVVHLYEVELQNRGKIDVDFM